MMDHELLLKALILGILEGLTEFLPVSSTGHLILVRRSPRFQHPARKNLRGRDPDGCDVGHRLGYRARLRRVLRGLPSHPRAQRFALNLTIAFLPAAVLGLAFGKYITLYLFTPVPVALAFITGGVVMLWAERREHRVRVADVDSIGPLDALKVGCAQCLALVPGTSRAGATIIGGLLFGLSRTAATDSRSFSRCQPLIGAGAYQLYKEHSSLAISDLSWFGAGSLAAFGSAFLCVRWLLRYVSSHDFSAFAWYRIAFGIVVIVTAYTGLVNWTAN